jgi:hypothetical protein
VAPTTVRQPAQLKGIAAVGVYTFAISVVFRFAIKATLGLRVSNEEEEEGLDIGEHGEVAYVGSASSRSSGPITSIALGIVIAAAMTKLSQGRR